MSFASSETSMHVNAKQAAKNVKMTCYPKPLICTLIQKNRADNKNSVTASLETLYKSSYTTTAGICNYLSHHHNNNKNL